MRREQFESRVTTDARNMVHDTSLGPYVVVRWSRRDDLSTRPGGGVNLSQIRIEFVGPGELWRRKCIKAIQRIPLLLSDEGNSRSISRCK